MSSDLDPRKHLLQYGALGAVCAVLLGLLVTWTTVLGNRLLKHLDRVDETSATQAQATREISRAMNDQKAVIERNAEASERLNEVLEKIRITGRRR